MSTVSSTFYRDLPALESFSTFFDASSHSPLPDDWHVLVADVRDSKRAIEAGHYRNVNTVGVACIAAMRDGFPDQDYPFVFGGDGASFCIPTSALENAKTILLDCQQLARKDFDLDLRIGAVPVTLLRELGTDVCIGKLRISLNYAQAMVTGDGWAMAERLVKSSHQFLIQRSKSSLRASFAGFECRWREIPSPSEENISLLVMALEDTELERRLTYTHVQHLIESIYGSPETHHPVRVEELNLDLSPLSMRSEARVRNPGFNRVSKAMHMLSVWPLVATGRYLMENKVRTEFTDWGGYKARLRDNTDFRKFDDLLRMVIAGTLEQRAKLRSRLSELAASGRIVDGLHASEGALLTCIVGDYNDDHVHLVDGSNGGYAVAAVELKAQLKAFEARVASVDEAVGEDLHQRLRDVATQHERRALPVANRPGSISAPEKIRSASTRLQ